MNDRISISGARPRREKQVGNIIRKVPGGWKVYSEKGRALSGVLKKKADAHKRLAEVEWFKTHKRGGK